MDVVSQVSAKDWNPHTNVCPLDFPHSLVLFLPALTAIKIARVVGHLRVLVPPKPADKP